MAVQESFDLVVIGAGPGGYLAGVRAAQLGLKVACVERSERPGGVCLNVGCIPSKALLDSSELYYLAGKRLADHGVRMDRLQLDLPTMMARKERVVKELTENVRKLLEGNKVRLIKGFAGLLDGTTIAVKNSDDKDMEIRGNAILLATGSEPVSVPGLSFDRERIVSSTEALSFESVPKRLGVVGGGYIGLELGSVWSRLGSQVTVIEMLPKIAAALDGQMSRVLQRILSRQGLSFQLQTKVSSARVERGEVVLELESGDKKEELTCDRLLVAVGRRPLTRGLHLDKVGIETDPRTGQVIVDSKYRTNVATVYAIGDLIAGPMLAHKASAEGIAAVEGIAGLAGEVNYDTIPAVIYTSPEVASVGLTEEQVRERAIEYCVGSYPFSGAGRARCMGETDGLVKVLAHGKTDRILGIHIIGPRASDMIAECGLAMEFGASSEDIARTVHAHPTFAEALHEAAVNVQNCSIYAS
ncbi:MAG: dihydrolipoyl dehydrogenase [Desulforhabdus sp.]|jgi:dihydrolipoamide dehydrogenase|nr:dihydrolipoyl dehydrogenase [Desulforhabdus sp.]